MIHQSTSTSFFFLEFWEFAPFLQKKKTSKDISFSPCFSKKSHFFLRNNIKRSLSISVSLIPSLTGVGYENRPSKDNIPKPFHFFLLFFFHKPFFPRSPTLFFLVSFLFFGPCFFLINDDCFWHCTVHHYCLLYMWRSTPKVKRTMKNEKSKKKIAFFCCFAHDESLL